MPRRARSSRPVWRSPPAAIRSSGPCGCAGPCPASAGGPSGRGASPTIWARSWSPRHGAWTSAPTPTPACRRSPGWSPAEVLHRDSLVPAAAARTRRVGVGHGAARAHRPAHRIGPARPVYLDGLIMTVQAPEELSRCRSGRGRRLSDRGRGAHQRCPTRLGPDGPGRLAWRRTGRQRSHSLSSSSACLVRGAVVTCSCWNRNRSAVLSLTDSVWLPAANTTISCWSTSGSR